MDLGVGSVFAGCHRNAASVASAGNDKGASVAIVAAGERWGDGGALRPCFEDLAGAGDVDAALQPASTWPESLAAMWAFRSAERAGLSGLIASCSSGREL